MRCLARFTALSLLCVWAVAFGESQAQNGQWLHDTLKAGEGPAGQVPTKAFILDMNATGFVQGAWDAYADVGILCGSVTAGQTRQVVLNYLEAHPERWQEPAILSVRDALLQHFPCKSHK